MKINWKNPLTKEASVILVPTGTGDLLECVTRTPCLYTGTTREPSIAEGYKTAYANAQDDVGWEIPDSAYFSDRFPAQSEDRTFLALIVPEGTFGTARTIFSYGRNLTGQRVSLNVNTSANLQISIQGSNYSSSLGINTNELQWVGYRFSGSQLQDFTILSDDLEESATGTASVNTIRESTTENLIFGDPYSFTLTGLRGHFIIGAMFRNASTWVAREFMRNPWQVFERSAIIVPLIPSVEVVEEEATTVIITDVDGDETWTDGDSGLVATGSGFLTFP